MLTNPAGEQPRDRIQQLLSAAGAARGRRRQRVDEGKGPHRQHASWSGRKLMALERNVPFQGVRLAVAQVARGEALESPRGKSRVRHRCPSGAGDCRGDTRVGCLHDALTTAVF